MVELIDNKADDKVELTIRGKGYNVMLQKADNYGNFKVDLVIEDEAELAKLKAFVEKYGTPKIRNTLGYAGDNGKPLTDINAFTARRKEVTEGDYKTLFVPTTDAETGEVIKDEISHGADMTITIRAYSYPAGKSTDGFAYKAGNSFQLQRVQVHSYEPFVRGESKAAKA